MALLSAILVGIRRVLVTYDIACQWWINLQKRLRAYGPPLFIDLEALSLCRPAIPKFHLIGHGLICQVLFNLMLMDGVGLTHGEGVETIWSHAAALQTWSRESGPGARRLILDDHWSGWNWRKLVNSRKFPRHSVTSDIHVNSLCASSFSPVCRLPGEHLKKVLERAWKWSKSQRAVATSLGEAVSLHTLEVWQKMVEDYKADSSKPNPFIEPEISVFFLFLAVFQRY